MLEHLTVPTLAAASALIVSLILWWLFVEWVFLPRKKLSTRQSELPVNSDNSSHNKSNRQSNRKSDTETYNNRPGTAQQHPIFDAAINTNTLGDSAAHTFTDVADKAAPEPVSLSHKGRVGATVSTASNVLVSKAAQNTGIGSTPNKSQLTPGNHESSDANAKFRKESIGKEWHSKTDPILSTERTSNTSTANTTPDVTADKDPHTSSNASTATQPHSGGSNTTSPAHRKPHDKTQQHSRPAATPSDLAADSPDKETKSTTLRGSTPYCRERKGSLTPLPKPSATENSTASLSVAVRPGSPNTSLKQKPNPVHKPSARNNPVQKSLAHTTPIQQSSAQKSRAQKSQTRSLRSKPSLAKQSVTRGPTGQEPQKQSVSGHSVNDAQLAVLPETEAKADVTQQATVTNKQHSQTPSNKKNNISDKATDKDRPEKHQARNNQACNKQASKNRAGKHQTAKYQTAAKAKSPSVRNEASLQIQHLGTHTKTKTSDVVNFDEKTGEEKSNTSTKPTQGQSDSVSKLKTNTQDKSHPDTPRATKQQVSTKHKTNSPDYNVTPLASIANRNVPRQTTDSKQADSSSKSFIEMAMERQSDTPGDALQQKLNDDNTGLRAQLAASERKIASLQSTLNNLQQQEFGTPQPAPSKRMQRNTSSRPSLLSKVRVLDPAES